MIPFLLFSRGRGKEGKGMFLRKRTIAKKTTKRPSSSSSSFSSHFSSQAWEEGWETASDIFFFSPLPPPYLRKRGVGWRDKIDFPCSSVALPRFQSQGQGQSGKRRRQKSRWANFRILRLLTHVRSPHISENKNPLWGGREEIKREGKLRARKTFLFWKIWETAAATGKGGEGKWKRKKGLLRGRGEFLAFIFLFQGCLMRKGIKKFTGLALYQTKFIKTPIYGNYCVESIFDPSWTVAKISPFPLSLLRR